MSGSFFFFFLVLLCFLSSVVRFFSLAFVLFFCCFFFPCGCSCYQWGGERLVCSSLCPRCPSASSTLPSLPHFLRSPPSSPTFDIQHQWLNVPCAAFAPCRQCMSFNLLTVILPPLLHYALALRWRWWRDWLQCNVKGFTRCTTCITWRNCKALSFFLSFYFGNRKIEMHVWRVIISTNLGIDQRADVRILFVKFAYREEHFLVSNHA